MDIAERVHMLRMRAGLTLPAAAEHAGISHSHWWSIENGRRRNIGPDVLKKIAAALDCTAAELLGEDAPATPLTPIQKLWLGLLENLPPTRVPDACAQVARLAAESDPTDAMTRVPALAGND